ncbi:hypothetical protein [Bacillus sp. NPDC077027]|uniref:hypothetical protein n=1 Tax=Bacillus sp. NPDC077027 TaxID=3390548 RepID=UPI003CFD5B60
MQIKKEKEIRVFDDSLEGIVRTDVVHFSKDQLIQLKIHSSASSRRQGVVLISENGLTVSGGEKERTLILWEDRVNKEHIIKCSEGTVNIFNVWEEERMIGYHDHLSGMRIEKSQTGFIYHCNVGYAKEGFTSMIFSIAFLR